LVAVTAFIAVFTNTGWSQSIEPDGLHNPSAKVTVSNPDGIFYAQTIFVAGTSNPVKINYIDKMFTRWFLAGDGKVERSGGRSILYRRDLTSSVMLSDIVAKVGGKARAEVSLHDIFTLMNEQGSGNPGVLRTDGGLNAFFVRDQQGKLRNVNVSWTSYGQLGNQEGWNVSAGPVYYPDPPFPFGYGLYQLTAGWVFSH